MFLPLYLPRLTLRHPSVCIAPVKRLPLVLLFLAGASCTTLENRRDLYRSPAEGYEQWHPNPPPTRKPAGPPIPATATDPNAPTERPGVITFPEESLPDDGG